jgi:uncharacterized protein (DUF1810 family)
MDDPYDLQRFVTAQDAAGSYDSALRELRAGRKTGHWMWYVFPQIAGLGQSPTSRMFAIRSLEEARAYLAHVVLGSRIRECADILTGLQRQSAEQIFGALDAMKLRSSMTLFARAALDDGQFGAVLEQYFGGMADPATVALLGSTSQ